MPFSQPIAEAVERRMNAALTKHRIAPGEPARFLRRIARRLMHAHPADVDRRASELMLEDLAVALACDDGMDDAWQAFVRDFLPILERRAAASGEPPLADAVAEMPGYLAEEHRGPDQARRIGGYGGRAALTTWVMILAHRRSVEHRRRTAIDERAKRTVASFGDQGKAEPAAMQEDVGSVLDTMREAFRTMTPHEKNAVRWRFAAGLPQTAIATLLGVSKPRVTAILKSACGRFRSALLARFGADLSRIDGDMERTLVAAIERHLAEMTKHSAVGDMR